MADTQNGTICLVVDVPGETQEHFEAVMESLALTGPVPPDGARLVASGPREGGWQTVSIWDSKEAMERFFEERLGPAYRDAGVSIESSRREMFPVYRMLEVR